MCKYSYILIYLTNISYKKLCKDIDIELIYPYIPYRDHRQISLQILSEFDRIIDRNTPVSPETPVSSCFKFA